MSPESLVTNPEDYFAQLASDIRNAKHSVSLETYIFEADAIGRSIAAALCEAASKGIQVRVMADGVGSPFWPGALTPKFRESGVETQVFHPIPWHFWHWAQNSGPHRGLGKMLHFMNQMNRRNHRKTCVIDSHICWVGSFNVSESHLPANQGGQDFHDIAVRKVGPSASLVQAVFDETWNHRFRWTRSLKNQDQDLVRFNQTRKARRTLYRDLLDRISRSQRRVWILNAYFAPEKQLPRTLIQAARRGVDVRLVLTAQSDVPIFPYVSQTFYEKLLQNGVKIYELTQGILHAKALLIDDWAMVGSSNLNRRSLIHDWEMDIVLEDGPSLHELEAHCQNEIQVAQPITPHQIRWYQKLFGRILLFFRYWI